MGHQIPRIIAQSEKGRTEYLFTPERGAYKTGENKSGTKNGMHECHSWEKKSAGRGATADEIEDTTEDQIRWFLTW